jgi:proline/glutamate/leucine-rich protein 1
MELPGVRREATSIVPKLLPQLLALLQNARHLPSSLQVAALQLLAALLRCVPAALRSTATATERALQQLVLAAAASTGGGSAQPAAEAAAQQVLAQAAVCAALLPAAPGDAANWSETARKLMSSSHDVLDYLLMGLEGRPADAQYRTYLAPMTASQPGQQQQGSAAAAAAAGGWLSSLPWQQQQQGQAGQPAAARRQTTPAKLLLGMCVSALQQLLQKPFVVPVPVPGYCLALLAARLLQFDAAAAVAAGAVAGSTTMYQELLVLQPQLQAAGWRLLLLVVDAAGQQLQLQGTLLRLARQGLRLVQLSGAAALQARPAAVRCCMYRTVQRLLQAAGLAGVRGLAAEAMGCVVLELYGAAAAAGVGSTAAGGLGGKQQHRPAKRPRTAGGNDFEQFDAAASVAAAAAAGDEASRLAAAAAATPADLAAQEGALQLLRAVLEAGGQLLPSEVRAHADAVALHAAQTAAAAALRVQQAAVAPGSGSASALASLHVAAYQALLASVLVPCSHRPPFLGQALLLFRQGRSSSSPALAAVCQAAALQCEVLLHPRATAISSVRQFDGMQAVQPLAKPRMWSAVDAALGQAALPSTAAAGGAGSAELAQQQMVQQAAGGAAGGGGAAAGSSAAAAAAGAVANGVMVIGYPVHVPAQQQQVLQTQHTPLSLAMQQQPQLQASQQQQVGAAAPGQAGAPAGAPMAAGLSAAMDVDMQQAGKRQEQHAAEQAPLQQQWQLPATVVQQGGLEARGNAAAAAGGGNVGGGSDAAKTGLLGNLGQRTAPAAVFDGESSDSEGPLPDIDSGASSSESGEDEAEEQN